MTQQTQTQNQPLPRQFGKYVLVRKIALGGMAEIFKAKTGGAEGFEKEVVIKRILPHFTEDESFVKMFIDEASITSKLQHSNIVQIYDFDVCEGSYYIAMELIEGVDLKKVIDVGIKMGKPMSIAQTAWIMIELSKGLHYAHTKEYKGQPLNIVHRDISPHNAMVSYNGEVKLMDFGIAKAAQRSTKTMAGTVKGKVAYMSPEQARGKNLDGRSDLFALGIMLWEMLTAKRLFLGDSDFETLTNVLKNNPPPPSTINSKVPKDLDEIVLKALMKDRDERYASVELFQRDLTRWYYSNVTDLEAESLKKYMQEIFADEVAKLRALNDEEKGLVPGAASAPAGGGGGAAAAPPAAAQNERTVAMPLDGGAAHDVAPPRRASTQSGMAAAAGGTGGFGQQAPVGTAMTGAYGTGVQPERPKSKLWLWILLVVLLGGGAAAAIILTQGGDSKQPVTGGTTSAPPDAPPKETAELVMQVEPRSAKVTVDGKPAGDKVTGIELGSAVPVKVEAEGYVTYEDIVQVEKKSNILKIKLEKVRAKVPLVIEATGDAQAIIRVNGKPIGTGSGMYEGLDGDTIEIEVQPSAPDAKPIKETAVLDGTTKLKKIQAVKASAKVILKIEPAGAEVKANKGKVTMTAANDGALIDDLALNDTVEVTVSKGAEWSVWKENVALLKDAQELNVKLTKKAAAVTPEKVEPGPGPGVTPNPVGASGKLTILARPWAKVSVGGKPYGNAPTTIDMKAGSYTVTCTKGAIVKTVSVSVVAGKAATAQCGDMQ